MENGIAISQFHPSPTIFAAQLQSPRHSIFGAAPRGILSFCAPYGIGTELIRVRGAAVGVQHYLDVIVAPHVASALLLLRRDQVRLWVREMKAEVEIPRVLGKICNALELVRRERTRVTVVKARNPRGRLPAGVIQVAVQNRRLLDEDRRNPRRLGRSRSLLPRPRRPLSYERRRANETPHNNTPPPNARTHFVYPPFGFSAERNPCPYPRLLPNERLQTHFSATICCGAKQKNRGHKLPRLQRKAAAASGSRSRICLSGLAAAVLCENSANRMIHIPHAHRFTSFSGKKPVYHIALMMSSRVQPKALGLPGGPATGRTKVLRYMRRSTRRGRRRRPDKPRPCT